MRQALSTTGHWSGFFPGFLKPQDATACRQHATACQPTDLECIHKGLDGRLLPEGAVVFHMPHHCPIGGVKQLQEDVDFGAASVNGFYTFGDHTMQVHSRQQRSIMQSKQNLQCTYDSYLSRRQLLQLLTTNKQNCSSNIAWDTRKANSSQITSLNQVRGRKITIRSVMSASQCVPAHVRFKYADLWVPVGEQHRRTVAPKA